MLRVDDDKLIKIAPRNVKAKNTPLQDLSVADSPIDDKEAEDRDPNSATDVGVLISSPAAEESVKGGAYGFKPAKSQSVKPALRPADDALRLFPNHHDRAELCCEA